MVNRDVAGFVTTRLICALAMEAVRWSRPASRRAEDIDTACRLGFGHAMGPLATTDLTGVDILRNATMNIYAETADEKFFPPELLSRMVAAGDLGRKTGRGFYTYDCLSRQFAPTASQPPESGWSPASRRHSSGAATESAVGPGAASRWSVHRTQPPARLGVMTSEEVTRWSSDEPAARRALPGRLDVHVGPRGPDGAARGHRRRHR